MLENLRRKSLVKTYIDPIYATKFEHGHVIYGIISRFGKHTQRFSKKKTEASFPSTFDVLFPSFVYTYMKSKFRMIYCPKGTFTMGHNDIWNNKPRLETIERPFLLGETEITQELYTKVMGTNPSLYQKSSQNPVEKVSWEDAILFCNELSKLHGLDECYTKTSNVQYDWGCDFSKNGYRLPREKEWEYAAKAGTQNKWAGTDNIAELDKYAWFGGNEYTGSTHEVKSKRPNEWGFYDMSGNVWEWCWDKYDLEDPDDPSASAESDRVFRGGSWLCYDTSLLCSAFRRGNSPDDCDRSLGFRVCRSIVN